MLAALLKSSDCRILLLIVTLSFNTGIHSDENEGSSSATDINECSQDFSACDVYATCVNIDGSYFCQCKLGFTGNGTRCHLIIQEYGCDENAIKCHSNATCEYSGGFFTCICLSGFVGNGTFCEETDTCNFTSNPCHENAACNNSTGAPKCECKTGYYGDGAWCEETDKCNFTSNPCHENATCENSTGVPKCECKAGYYGDGALCEVEEQSSKLIWLCLLPIVIIVVIICVAYVRTHGLPKKRNNDVEMRNMSTKHRRSGMKNSTAEYDLSIHDLKEHYLKEKGEHFKGLRAQFDKLDKDIPEKMSRGHSKRNPRKNRFPAIVPFSENQVKLVDGYSDDGYINASLISDSTKAKRFIAAQSPFDETVNDFWQMIWENGVQIIIMLEYKDKEKSTCGNYWPERSTSYGDIICIPLAEYERGCFKEKICELQKYCKNVKEQRVIKQFHFMTWPDHGVPNMTSAILDMCTSIKHLKTTTPILVHCSNGSGRTGTFIALFLLLSDMEKGNSVNIFRAVRKLRKQRAYMVQNETQYLFLYKLVAEIYIMGDTSRHPTALPNYCQELERIQEDNMDGYDHQIQALEEFADSVMLHQNVTSGDQQGSSGTEEAFKVFRVYRLTDTSVVISDPITESEVSGFCELIFKNNVTDIVMLSAKSKSPYMRYWWDDEVGKGVSFGNISVACRRSSHNGHTTRNLTFRRHDGRIISVVQIQYTDWHRDTPANTSAFIEFILRLQRRRKERKKSSAVEIPENFGPILVHANDGSTRPILFCALYNLIRISNHEERIDVFRILKNINDVMPGRRLNKEQLIFCYSALCEAIETRFRPTPAKEHAD